MGILCFALESIMQRIQSFLPESIAFYFHFIKHLEIFDIVGVGKNVHVYIYLHGLIPKFHLPDFPLEKTHDF